jgi:hypothetical protein
MKKARKYKMKYLVLASAVVAASAFSALAQTAPVALSSAIEAQVLALVPDADLTNLTNAQYAQLVSLFGNSENLRAGADPEGAVKAILGAQ